MYLLTKYLVFPPVYYADEDGLLAIGGDLSSERLILAYNSGIFPWFSEDSPIMWFSPNQRMVLFPEKLKISKSMRQILRKEVFEMRFNTAFLDVIQNCAEILRKDQDSTWITKDMQKAYIKLHKMGVAISVETWKNDELVGGLYGVYLKEKGIFCGESMFSKVSNASKFAFIKMVEYLREKNVKLIDCQLHTEHLASLGAEEIPREIFMEYLK